MYLGITTVVRKTYIIQLLISLTIAHIINKKNEGVIRSRKSKDLFAKGSTKHYIEIKRSRNTNPNKTGVNSDPPEE